MTNMQEIKAKASKLPPIDESVELPAAIRAAAARSAELHKMVYEEEAPVNVQQPQQEEQPGGEDGKQKEANTKAPEAPKEQEANTAPAEPSSGDDWQHKYNSMKGRYEREKDTTGQLLQRIASLEGLLARQQEAPRPVAPVPQELTFKEVTPEERENYGEEFLDVASRAARERLAPELQVLQRKIDELSGKVGTVATTTEAVSKQNMYAFLTEKLPNWREINRDQNFLAWANLPDTYSGAIRLHMMNDAFNKGDGSRVLAFFKGFLSDEAATAPAKVEPSRIDPNNGKIPLETLAAPGRAKAPATTEVPGEKETISAAQIAAFYADVQRGKYRGNEAEKDRLERMIFAAQAEGRVV